MTQGQMTQGKLFIVATPIGNLADMTERAIQILKTVDVIACEDTRTSQKLLSHYAITTKMSAYHDHNADTQTQRLIQLLTMGKNIALISDAGTPLISDPGYRLVKACHEMGIGVSPIVGASAMLGALSVAGLPSDKFYFYGFLPAKTTARKAELATLKHQTATLIFYEAPHRILATLADMYEVLGERSITFCRELTKTFETVYPSTLSGLIDFVQSDPNQQKGEMVLVVGGAVETPSDACQHDTLLLALSKELPINKVAKVASEITGIKKNALYDRVLELKQAGL